MKKNYNNAFLMLILTTIVPVLLWYFSPSKSIFNIISPVAILVSWIIILENLSRKICYTWNSELSQIKKYVNNLDIIDRLKNEPEEVMLNFYSELIFIQKINSQTKELATPIVEFLALIHFAKKILDNLPLAPQKDKQKCYNNAKKVIDSMPYYLKTRLKKGQYGKNSLRRHRYKPILLFVVLNDMMKSGSQFDIMINSTIEETTITLKKMEKETKKELEIMEKEWEIIEEEQIKIEKELIENEYIKNMKERVKK